MFFIDLEKNYYIGDWVYYIYKDCVYNEYVLLSHRYLNNTCYESRYSSYAKLCKRLMKIKGWNCEIR